MPRKKKEKAPVQPVAEASPDTSAETPKYPAPDFESPKPEVPVDTFGPKKATYVPRRDDKGAAAAKSADQQDRLKAQLDAKAKADADWLEKTVKAMAQRAEAFKSGLEGKVIPYTEKNGQVVPSIVCGTKEVNSTDEAGQKKYDENGNPIFEKRVLVWVMSLENAQPYRTEIKI